MEDVRKDLDSLGSYPEFWTVYEVFDILKKHGLSEERIYDLLRREATLEEVFEMMDPYGWDPSKIYFLELQR